MQPPLISGSNGGPVALLGRGLAHRHLGPEARAEMAAVVALELRPFKPSRQQLCQIFNVSMPMLRRAIEDTEVFVPISAVAEVETNSNGQNPVAVGATPEISTLALIDRLAAAPPAERLAIAQALGVDVLWDTFIRPAIDAKTDGNHS